MTATGKRRYAPGVTIPAWIRRPLPYREGNAALVLIAINVVLFLLSTFAPLVSRLLSMTPVLTVQRGLVFQPFTYMFMHFNFRHLFVNMLGLFFFGTQVERTIGTNEFLAFYLATGFLAGVFSLAVFWVSGVIELQTLEAAGYSSLQLANAVPPAWTTTLLGASGAVFAVLLAFATYYPDARIFIFGILPVRAAMLVVLYTVIELVSQIRGRPTGVAHLTHLAGFGFAYLYLRLRLGIDPVHRLLGRR